MFGLIPFDRKSRHLSSPGASLSDTDLLFDQFFSDAFAPMLMPSTRQMKVDIREDKKAYYLDADLPGINKDQVHIEVVDDQLKISVTTDEQNEEKKEGYICRERRYGSVARSFALANITSDAIKATMKNGILSVTLPKAEPGKPKSKTIQID